MDLIHFEFFFLILIRITSFMVASPIFSMRGIPNIVKTGFSLFLSIIVFFAVPVPNIDFGNHFLTYALLIINEIIFGLSIGYITNMIFIAMQIAGQYIDIQIGFSMAMIYDPTTGSSISLFSRLYNWVGIALLFALDGHHYLIYAISRSFEAIPVGAINLAAFNVADVIGFFSQSFAIALKISMPIIMILLLTDIIMGLISRTVPQLNVFILGMPLKVILGLSGLFVLAAAIVNMMVPIIESIPSVVDKSMGLFK